MNEYSSGPGCRLVKTLFQVNKIYDFRRLWILIIFMIECDFILFEAWQPSLSTYLKTSVWRFLFWFSPLKIALDMRVSKNFSFLVNCPFNCALQVILVSEAGIHRLPGKGVKWNSGPDTNDPWELSLGTAEAAIPLPRMHYSSLESLSWDFRQNKCVEAIVGLCCPP